MCRISYYGEFLIFDRSCSDTWKKNLFQQKIYAIQIIFLTLGVGGIFPLAPCHQRLFAAMSSTSWPPQAAEGPASSCWPSSTSLFPAHSTSPSFPRGVSGSICPVTSASAAVLETWAGAFPSEALSEVTCCGSLSHRTTKCCTCGYFAVSYRERHFWKIFMIIKEPSLCRRIVSPLPLHQLQPKHRPSRDSCFTNPLPRNQKCFLCSADWSRGRKKVIMSLHCSSHNLLCQLNSHGLVPKSNIYLALYSHFSLHGAMVSFLYKRIPNLIPVAVKIHFKTA